MISSFENGLEFSEFPTDNFMKKANKTIHEIQRALTWFFSPESWELFKSFSTIGLLLCIWISNQDWKGLILDNQSIFCGVFLGQQRVESLGEFATCCYISQLCIYLISFLQKSFFGIHLRIAEGILNFFIIYFE